MNIIYMDNHRNLGEPTLRPEIIFWAVFRGVNKKFFFFSFESLSDR